MERAILFPDERKASVLEAFEAARHSLAVGMFRWEDQELLSALESARSRDVRARVLLSERAKGWGQRLRALQRRLQAMGVEVQRYHTKASKYHAKYVVADERLALVSSFNFTSGNFQRTCDFGLLTQERETVLGLARLFEADWEGEENVEMPPRVVVTPGDGRRRILKLFLAARKSIDIVDHRLWAPDILQVLGLRAAENVTVRVLGQASAENEPAIQCYKPPEWEPHGKLMIVDNEVAMLGSISPVTRLLDHRRELSILASEPACVQKLADFFEEKFRGDAGAPDGSA